jgi:hypothetical protein
VIIVEVLFDLGIPINVHVIEKKISLVFISFISLYLDCTLTVHRRCISKVGNYCGCEENVLALYEKWKETVCLREKKTILFINFYFQQVYEPNTDYQYNEDLYTIYANLDKTDGQQDIQRVQNAIERISKSYRPNITAGFDVKNYKLIRALGQGMNGSVSKTYLPCFFYKIFFFLHRFI